MYRLRLAFRCSSAACHINTCDGKGGYHLFCYVSKLDLQCMEIILGGSSFAVGADNFRFHDDRCRVLCW